jgi:putative oxidoreductase
MKSKGLLVLRVVAGLIFVLHGWGKLSGNPSIEMFSGMVGNLGFPMPLFFAWVVALTEFLGGLALILGIFVRPAAILLSVVMVIAFSMVKKFALPAGDPDLALFGIVVALALMGPGRYSVMGMMKKGEKVCVEESAK